MPFIHTLLVNSDKTIRISTLYILNMLYTGCSTKEAISLLSRGALTFQETLNFTYALSVNSDKLK